MTCFHLMYVNRDGYPMRGRKCSSGTSDLTPFEEFMISPIHYINNYRICHSWDYVYGLMTGLFAWIGPAALSRTYFI